MKRPQLRKKSSQTQNRTRLWRASLARQLKRKRVLFPLIVVGSILAGFTAVILTMRMLDVSSVLKPLNSTTVEITYDKQTQIVPTTAKTVNDLLKKMDITLHDGDTVEPARDAEIAGDIFKINIYRARPVVLIDGTSRTYAVSAATTPRSIARQVGMTVYPEDRLSVLKPGDFLSDYSLGKEIAVERSVPVNVNLYGRYTPMRTLAKTVGDLLKEKNIQLPNGSTVHPSAETPLTANEQVFVLARGVAIEVREEVIPMPVENVEDKTLSFGSTVVRQQGTAGKRLVTYQTNSETGEQVKIQEIIAQEAVTQIVAKGTFSNIPSDKQGVMAAAGISASDFTYVDYIVSRESRWNAGAKNTRSGAYGLCQSLPGTKMASAGSDWETNPVTQLRWCHGYAIGRYGSWQAAYNTWVSKHWW